MADTPVPWAILELVQARLRIIRRANDYRTDAGRDVRLEPAPFDPNDTVRLTLYPLASVLPDDAGSTSERGFTFVVEALIPVRIDNAQQRIIETIADIEDALDGYTQAPLALGRLAWLGVSRHAFEDRSPGQPGRPLRPRRQEAERAWECRDAS